MNKKKSILFIILFILFTSGCSESEHDELIKDGWEYDERVAGEKHYIKTEVTPADSAENINRIKKLQGAYIDDIEGIAYSLIEEDGLFLETFEVYEFYPLDELEIESTLTKRIKDGKIQPATDPETSIVINNPTKFKDEDIDKFKILFLEEESDNLDQKAPLELSYILSSPNPGEEVLLPLYETNEEQIPYRYKFANYPSYSGYIDNNKNEKISSQTKNHSNSESHIIQFDEPIIISKNIETTLDYVEIKQSQSVLFHFSTSNIGDEDADVILAPPNRGSNPNIPYKTVSFNLGESDSYEVEVEVNENFTISSSIRMTLATTNGKEGEDLRNRHNVDINIINLGNKNIELLENANPKYYEDITAAEEKEDEEIEERYQQEKEDEQNEKRKELSELLEIKKKLDSFSAEGTDIEIYKLSVEQDIEVLRKTIEHYDKE